MCLTVSSSVKKKKKKSYFIVPLVVLYSVTISNVVILIVGEIKAILSAL